MMHDIRPSPSRDPLLKVENLVVEYAVGGKTIHAVSDVSLPSLKNQNGPAFSVRSRHPPTPIMSLNAVQPGVDLLDSLPNPLGKTPCLFLRPGGGDGEFVAAIPAEGLLLRLDCRFEGRRDRFQKPVAGDVAVLLVQQSELVQIDEEDGDLSSGGETACRPAAGSCKPARPPNGPADPAPTRRSR